MVPSRFQVPPAGCGASQIVRTGPRHSGIYDVTRVGARTRFTFDPANEALSLWSLDGTRIIFTSDRTRRLEL